MLIDPHVHTSGISACSIISFEELTRLAPVRGVNALVLTNHIQSWYYDDEIFASLVRRGVKNCTANDVALARQRTFGRLRSNPLSYDGFMRAYVDEYDDMSRCGKKYGVKVFFGMEITLALADGNHDYLVYGATPDFLLNAPKRLYSMSQKELYEYTKSRNALLYQAHPFRWGTLTDVNYLDGLEVNCNTMNSPEEAKIRELAKKYDKGLSCGSDMHSKEQNVACGIIIPDEIDNSLDFADYLRREKAPELVVSQEVIRENND